MQMRTWRDVPELFDRKSLAALIEVENTPMNIAKRLGCSRESVKHAMKHHGLKTKKFHIEEDMKRRLFL